MKKGKHTQNNKVKLKKKAFDNDCYVKRKGLERPAKLINKFPNNDYIRKKGAIEKVGKHDF